MPTFFKGLIAQILTSCLTLFCVCWHNRLLSCKTLKKCLLAKLFNFLMFEYIYRCLRALHRLVSTAVATHYCSFHYDWGELESDLRPAWIRKHRCFCGTSQWGVGLVRLVPGFWEAPGTVSHRAEVHTELMIISFLNPLCLPISISSSDTNMQMFYSRVLGRSNKCMQEYISKDLSRAL